LDDLNECGLSGAFDSIPSVHVSLHFIIRLPNVLAHLHNPISRISNLSNSISLFRPLFHVEYPIPPCPLTLIVLTPFLPMERNFSCNTGSTSHLPQFCWHVVGVFTEHIASACHPCVDCGSFEDGEKYDEGSEQSSKSEKLHFDWRSV